MGRPDGPRRRRLVRRHDAHRPLRDAATARSRHWAPTRRSTATSRCTRRSTAFTRTISASTRPCTDRARSRSATRSRRAERGSAGQIPARVDPLACFGMAAGQAHVHEPPSPPLAQTLPRGCIPRSRAVRARTPFDLRSGVARARPRRPGRHAGQLRRRRGGGLPGRGPAGRRRSPPRLPQRVPPPGRAARGRRHRHLPRWARLPLPRLVVPHRRLLAARSRLRRHADDREFDGDGLGLFPVRPSRGRTWCSSTSTRTRRRCPTTLAPFVAEIEAFPVAELRVQRSNGPKSSPATGRPTPTTTSRATTSRSCTPAEQRGRRPRGTASRSRDRYCSHARRRVTASLTLGMWLWRFPNLALNLYPDGMNVERFMPLGPRPHAHRLHVLLPRPRVPSATQTTRSCVCRSSCSPRTARSARPCSATSRPASTRRGTLSPKHENGVAYFHGLVRDRARGRRAGALMEEQVYLPAAALPTLSDAQLARLHAYGDVVTTDAGRRAVRGGRRPRRRPLRRARGRGRDRAPDAGRPRSSIARDGAGRFIGELNLLTGQRRLPDRPGHAEPAGSSRRPRRVPPPDRVRSRSRRRHLRGARGPPARPAARTTARPARCASSARASRPKRWRCAAFAGAQPAPARVGRPRGRRRRRRAAREPRPAPPTTRRSCITPTGVLRQPTPGEFAEHLGPHVPRRAGLPVRSRRGRDRPGRAGGRGLRRVGGPRHGVARRRRRPAARPASSSRIENYVGFPNGISGEELADAGRDPGAAARRAPQRAVRGRRPAQRARLPRGRARRRQRDPAPRGDRRVRRARYQRLAVDGLERFEGAGVYYAATDLEARVCAGLARHRRRRRQLGRARPRSTSRSRAAACRSRSAATTSRASMSHYLDRTDRGRPPHHAARPAPRCARSHGDGHLERGRPSSTRRPASTRSVAVRGPVLLHRRRSRRPAGSRRRVALDDAGFVLTDRYLPDDRGAGPDVRGATRCRSRRRVPGVFAVGDVRHGSMKRVAAAVGEGSSAVRSTQVYLSSLV